MLPNYLTVRVKTVGCSCVGCESSPIGLMRSFSFFIKAAYYLGSILTFYSI